MTVTDCYSVQKLYWTPVKRHLGFGVLIIIYSMPTYESEDTVLSSHLGLRREMANGHAQLAHGKSNCVNSTELGLSPHWPMGVRLWAMGLSHTVCTSLVMFTKISQSRYDKIQLHTKGMDTHSPDMSLSRIIYKASKSDWSISCVSVSDRNGQIL
jgi:hypothetical protein